MLDMNYFRAVQGGTGINTEEVFKSETAQDNLRLQFRTSINYVEDAKRNDVSQPFIITGTESKYKYNVTAMPDDELYPGDIIEANGEHFIIVSTRAMSPNYILGQGWMCNVLFRFQNNSPTIIERYGVLDSGVYSTTIGTEDVLSYMKRQYKIYLPGDDETYKIYIDKRLAVDVMYDQYGNKILEAYHITGRTRHGKGAYGDGTHLLELSAKSSEEIGARDNIELMICDYISLDDTSSDEQEDTSELLACSISGRSNLRLGASRTYTATFYDANGAECSVDDIVWSIDLPDGISMVATDNKCVLTVTNNDSLSGTTLTLIVKDSSGLYAPATMEVGVF